MASPNPDAPGLNARPDVANSSKSAVKTANTACNQNSTQPKRRRFFANPRTTLAVTGAVARPASDSMRASGGLGLVILGLFARTLENRDDAFLQVSALDRRSGLR